MREACVVSQKRWRVAASHLQRTPVKPARLYSVHRCHGTKLQTQFLPLGYTMPEGASVLR